MTVGGHEGQVPCPIFLSGTDWGGNAQTAPRISLLHKIIKKLHVIDLDFEYEDSMI